MKHSQCFDVALMKDGSIVLASKDYIYHYLPEQESCERETNLGY